MAYGTWNFPEQNLNDITFDIELPEQPDSSTGLFYQLYQGAIAGSGFYFGFQTDLYKPNIGWVGPGLLFSRWGSRNEQDARIAHEGYLENGDHEGGFLGVRFPYNWKPGKYTCWLRPSETDDKGRWYTFEAKHAEDQQLVSAGSFHFEEDSNGNCMIQSGGISWTEVYKGVASANEVPFSKFRVHRIVANGESISPASCRTTCNKSFPNADAFFDGEDSLVLQSGIGAERDHEDMTYFF